ncbi:MAG: response regulator [Pseudomonadota bacterium]|jgi:two-component system chemotaxis response regulator CheY
MSDPKKILVVDDSRTVRQLLKMVLTKGFKCQVAEVEDGMEALQSLQTDTYDLVITDINMPNMDGLTLVRKIRTEVGLTVPIIIITTLGKEEDRDKGLELGADSYLTKPFNGPNVIKTASQLLGQVRGQHRTSPKSN